MMQKENSKTEKQEVSRALEELEDAEDEDIYVSVSNLLISKDYDDVKEELEEKLEDLEVRIKSLEKKENKIKEKVQDTQSKFAQQMQGMGGGMAQ